MAISAPSAAQQPPVGGASRQPPHCRFEDALRRAETGRGPGQARAPVQHPARPPPRHLDRRSERSETTGADGVASATAAPPRPPTPPGIPELQAALRAAPPAIVSAAAGKGPVQLALSFGAALSVDLRAGAQGLELSLRPAPSLERAARAELPRLVEALRSRGLRVARADVACTPAAQAPSRAR